MPIFLLRRLLQALMVMLTVALIAFLMFRFLGDPVNSIVSQDATQVEREEVRERLAGDGAIPLRVPRYESEFEGRITRAQAGQSQFDSPEGPLTGEFPFTR